MNRAPAFQFYPDKWQSHTKRLSDSAYRVYHEMICWMWQHSEDQCSIDADPNAIACALAMRPHRVKAALSSIQNKYSPLLKREGVKLVSHGLRKEIQKMEDRRKKNSENANKRWVKPMPSHESGIAKSEKSQCSPSPSPSPSPIPPSGVEPPAWWSAFLQETQFEKLTYEDAVILFHGRGLDPEKSVVELLPIMRTANWHEVKRHGEARWLGWQLDDMNKRNKNGGEKKSNAKPRYTSC